MTAPFPPSWVRALTTEDLERLAIRTVDGTMDDWDALTAERLTRLLWEAKAKHDKERKEARL
ncbi:MAG: hypothetical protein GX595_18315 [Lentisphaerae bacterium]|nr:hypothetical protein [Lentisphaerota bacterium]